MATEHDSHHSDSFRFPERLVITFQARAQTNRQWRLLANRQRLLTHRAACFVFLRHPASLQNTVHRMGAFTRTETKSALSAPVSRVSLGSENDSSMPCLAPVMDQRFAQESSSNLTWRPRNILGHTRTHVSISQTLHLTDQRGQQSIPV